MVGRGPGAGFFLEALLAFLFWATFHSSGEGWRPQRRRTSSEEEEEEEGGAAIGGLGALWLTVGVAACDGGDG